MKRFLVILTVLTLFSSCILPTGVEMMRDPDMRFSSLQECQQWIADNIDYDNSGSYEWQSPYQTMEKRSGMCVDYCSLLLWYAVEEFEVSKSSAYIQKVVTKRGIPHAICVINGVWIEPQNNTVVFPRNFLTVLERVSYEDIYYNIYYLYGNRSIGGENCTIR